MRSTGCHRYSKIREAANKPDALFISTNMEEGLKYVYTSEMPGRIERPPSSRAKPRQAYQDNEYVGFILSWVVGGGQDADESKTLVSSFKGRFDEADIYTWIMD